jgi:5,10-methylenetetrahydromethanopterin reductase
MRIGLNAGGPNLARTIEDAVRAEDEGFAAYSMPGDSTATLGLIGAKTRTIRLLTAVVPIFGLHPASLAGQARVAQAAADGRFTLGIGLAHRVSVEGVLGMSFEHPAARMEEYLRVLGPRLRDEEVDFAGKFYTYHATGRRPDGAPSVDCVVAALGPVMLRLCTELAGGTILWMANARAIEEYVAPRIRRAAERAGKAAGEIVASLPVALTDDVATAREEANRQFANYGQLPSYRGILDRGGAATPGDAALIGNEAQLDAELDRLERAGVTLFNASVFRAEPGGPARTREFMASRARERNRL